VVLCDSRVISKAYGRAMLEALPDAKRVVGRWEEIVRELKAFYEG
jgi:Rad3-related DNA helicase